MYSNPACHLPLTSLPCRLSSYTALLSSSWVYQVCCTQVICTFSSSLHDLLVPSLHHQILPYLYKTGSLSAFAQNFTSSAYMISSKSLIDPPSDRWLTTTQVGLFHVDQILSLENNSWSKKAVLKKWHLSWEFRIKKLIEKACMLFPDQKKKKKHIQRSWDPKKLITLGKLEEDWYSWNKGKRLENLADIYCLYLFILLNFT